LRARDMLRAMGDLGVPPGAIYATGGWTRSRALVELRAGLFGAPVLVVDDIGLTAVGAALLAREGASGQPAPLIDLRVTRIDPRSGSV
jgi:xylulokinase